MSGRKKNRLELYVHIPFCARKCAYCDFLSSAQSADARERYVKKLVGEITASSAHYREFTVSTVFMGGGTPSILEPGQTARIFDALRAGFFIDEGAEITMEANPGTVSEEKLSACRKAGINRLSFGLQSADNGELRVLGRIHTWEDFLESYRLARKCGFENINIDLMSALPGQTVDSWRRTLEKTAARNPEHISAYSLILEEGTPFFDRYGDHGPDRGLIPDEDSDREMYHLTKRILGENGFERYEISNYARPGRECRHNTGYWIGTPYLGLGLGASSYVGGARFFGERDLAAYLNTDFERIFAGGNRIPSEYYHEVQQLSPREMQEEFFFLGLRLARGVSLREFETRFGVSAQEAYPGLFCKLEAEGAGRLCGGRFCLTEYGMDVSNAVMAEFL